MPNNNDEINILKKYSRIFLTLFLLIGIGMGIHFFFFHTYDKSYKQALLTGMGIPTQEFKKLNSILQAARWYAQYIEHSDVEIFLAKESQEIIL